MRVKNYRKLRNRADWVRLLNYANQIQFMRNDDKNRLLCTESAYEKAFNNNRDQTIGLAMFFQRMGKLNYYREKTNELTNRVNEKLEYLITGISIDYYKEGKEGVLRSPKVVTTVSFEDVKSLYEDLYEHILKTVIMTIGIDNVLMRGDFMAIREKSDIYKNDKNLEGLSRISKHGWILNYIEEGAESEPLQGLLCGLLSQRIRNSIGHFDYEEVGGSHGQTIRLLDSVKTGESFEVTLKEICYDI